MENPQQKKTRREDSRCLLEAAFAARCDAQLAGEDPGHALLEALLGANKAEPSPQPPQSPTPTTTPTRTQEVPVAETTQQERVTPSQQLGSPQLVSRTLQHLRNHMVLFEGGNQLEALPWLGATEAGPLEMVTDEIPVERAVRVTALYRSPLAIGQPYTVEFSTKRPDDGDFTCVGTFLVDESGLLEHNRFTFELECGSARLRLSVVLAEVAAGEATSDAPRQTPPLPLVRSPRRSVLLEDTVAIDAEQLLTTCALEGERHVLAFARSGEMLALTSDRLAAHLITPELSRLIGAHSHLPLLNAEGDPWETVVETDTLPADGVVALTLRCHEQGPATAGWPSRVWLLPSSGRPTLLAELRGQWQCKLLFQMRKKEGYMRVDTSAQIVQLSSGVLLPGARLIVSMFAWAKRQVVAEEFAPVVSIVPARGTESEGLHHVLVE